MPLDLGSGSAVLPFEVRVRSDVADPTPKHLAVAVRWARLHLKRRGLSIEPIMVEQAWDPDTQEKSCDWYARGVTHCARAGDWSESIALRFRERLMGLVRELYKEHDDHRLRNRIVPLAERALKNQRDDRKGAREANKARRARSEAMIAYARKLAAEDPEQFDGRARKARAIAVADEFGGKWQSVLRLLDRHKA